MYAAPPPLSVGRAASIRRAVKSAHRSRTSSSVQNCASRISRASEHRVVEDSGSATPPSKTRQSASSQPPQGGSQSVSSSAPASICRPSSSSTSRETASLRRLADLDHAAGQVPVLLVGQPAQQHPALGVAHQHLGDRPLAGQERVEQCPEAAGLGDRRVGARAGRSTTLSVPLVVDAPRGRAGRPRGAARPGSPAAASARCRGRRRPRPGPGRARRRRSRRAAARRGVRSRGRVCRRADVQDTPAAEPSGPVASQRHARPTCSPSVRTANHVAALVVPDRGAELAPRRRPAWRAAERRSPGHPSRGTRRHGPQPERAPAGAGHRGRGGLAVVARRSAATAPRLPTPEPA